MNSLPIVGQCASPARASPRWFEDPSEWHSFRTDDDQYLFVVDGSRIYRLDESASALLSTMSSRHGMNDTIPRALGVPKLQRIGDDPCENVPMRSASLAVAQSCNLACTYCYAQGGSFGGVEKNMPLETALRAVDSLMQDANPSETVSISFLGGEPMVNRAVIRAATEYAAREAQRFRLKARFSITTNGTLLTPEDGEFFDNYGFAITISIDGVGTTHDLLRPFKGGGGSYQRVLDRVRPLLQMQRRMQMSARVTVTPRNLDLVQILQEFIDIGFHSVGFSPLLNASNGQNELKPADLQAMLERMIECGGKAEAKILAGERFPFSNFHNALEQIHRGIHRPYPCGAGAGYHGVSADGELFACHRFVDDPAGRMGNLSEGIDPTLQNRWLAERHVHRQEPCNSCWARYLCGGGCHHEVIHRGRTSCDYIRGWLHYCLEAYARIQELLPDYFTGI